MLVPLLHQPLRPIEFTHRHRPGLLDEPVRDHDLLARKEIQQPVLVPAKDDSQFSHLPPDHVRVGPRQIGPVRLQRFNLSKNLPTDLHWKPIQKVLGKALPSRTPVEQDLI